MKKEGKRKKGDLIIILIVLLIGVGASLPWLWNKINPSEDKQGEELIAVIKRDGKEMARLDLNSITEPQRFHYDDGIEVTILAEKGKIRFEQAACPDKICVKTGTLTKPGDIAVCMPSETIVVIEGDKY